MKDKIRDLVRKHLAEMLKQEENQNETVTEEEIEENSEVTLDEEAEIFAPNHYCVHHGGVNHNGNIELAEAVNHNFNEELGRVTHYDMKLQDGTILENIPFEEIQVTNASLAEGHGHPMKRDDEEEKESEELDEMHCGSRDDEEAIEEGEKPDFLDLDKDGDKEESMKSAAADKKEKNESKVMTTEKESALYEGRFEKRDNNLYERLVKTWINNK